MERKVHPNENDVNLLYKAHKFHNLALADKKWDRLERRMSAAKLERLLKLGWVEWFRVKNVQSQREDSELNITEAGLEAIKDMQAIKQAEEAESLVRQQKFNEARLNQEQSLKSYLEVCKIKPESVRCWSSDVTEFNVDFSILRVSHKYAAKRYIITVWSTQSEGIDSQTLIKEAQDAQFVCDYLNTLLVMAGTYAIE